MRASKLVLVAMLSIVACSCFNREKQSNHSNGKDGQTSRADNQKFENTQDPPISADTYFAAAQLAETQDAPARAIQQYQAALKSDPKHLPSIFRLGTLYTQIRMFPQAVDAWQAYVKATNGSAAAYNNLGFCYELARKLPDAEAAYKKGIARDATDQSCRVNYGLMLARQGKMKEAAEQFGAVLRPAEVHYNLGSVYEQQGKKQQARAEYEKTLLLDATLHDAKVRLAGLK
jgi:tetratricopeptide (TPR) repeat protein